MRELTKKQINQLKPFWKKLQDEEDKFYGKVQKIEKEMQEAIGEKNLEFFRCHNATMK